VVNDESIIDKKTRTVHVLLIETESSESYTSLLSSITKSLPSNVNVLTYKDVPDDSFRVALAGLREASSQKSYQKEI